MHLATALGLSHAFNWVNTLCVRFSQVCCLSTDCRHNQLLLLLMTFNSLPQLVLILVLVLSFRPEVIAMSLANSLTVAIDPIPIQYIHRQLKQNWICCCPNNDLSAVDYLPTSNNNKNKGMQII